MKVYFLFVTVLLPLFFSGPALQSQTEEDGANMKHFLYESSPGVYAVEDMVNAEIDADIKSEVDIKYHYYSREDPKGINIDIDDIDSIWNRFEFLRPTIFIIHDWKDDSGTSLIRQVREVILSQYDVNVFVVDWSAIVSKNYISAKNSVVQVGQYVAKFIRALQLRYWMYLCQLSLVGYALGAHVAGAAGADLKGEVDLIVGLDPAEPLFSVKNTEERLDPTDAQFVQVIHTSRGRLGFREPTGHADYYPNGGSFQSGCGLDLGSGCSHSRVYELYSEAIVADFNLFVAKKYDSYWNYGRGRCSDNAKSVLGGFEVDKNAIGEYYLDINSQSPFALG